MPLNQGVGLDQSPLLQQTDCQNRADGHYSMGCSEKFLMCSNGIANIHSCQSGLVFNEMANMCDHSSNVPICIGQQVPAIEPSQGGASGSAPGTQPQDQPQQTAAPWQIPNPIPVQQQQPAVQLYQQQSAALAQQQATSWQQASSLPNGQQQIAQVTAGFNCQNRPDGSYSLGCSADFIMCSNGVASLQQCQSGLVFNAALTVCDFPANVAACGGAQSPPTGYQQTTYAQTPSYTQPQTPSYTQPQTPSYTQPQTPSYTPPQTTAQAQSPAASPACQNRPDGSYSVGCSADFIMCSNGVASPHQCQSGLVFNAATTVCDFPTNVAACGGGGAQAPPSGYQQTNTQFTPPTSPECQNRLDGAFSVGCSGDYLVCSNGVATSQKCSDGLIFNAAITACDYPANVAACGGAQSPPTQTGDQQSSYYQNPAASADPPAQAVYQQSSYEQNPAASPAASYPQMPVYPTLSALFKGNCQAGRFYPRGRCMDTYLRCTDGINFDQLTCPYGQSFDPMSLICRVKSYISTCNYQEGNEPIYINNAATGKDVFQKEYFEDDIIMSVGYSAPSTGQSPSPSAYSQPSADPQPAAYSQPPPPPPLNIFNDFGSFEDHDDDLVSDVFGKGIHERRTVGQMLDFGGFFVKGQRKHEHRDRSDEKKVIRSPDAFEGKHFPRVLSNPFFAGQKRKTSELSDVLDKKSGHLTDSIFKFFPTHKKHRQSRKNHSHEHKHKKSHHKSKGDSSKGDDSDNLEIETFEGSGEELEI